jgi:hypothetical protein
MNFLHRRSENLQLFFETFLLAGVKFMTQPRRRLAMTQWDVFSSRPLEGNSLAVFSDGRGLTDARCSRSRRR